MPSGNMHRFLVRVSSTDDVPKQRHMQLNVAEEDRCFVLYCTMSCHTHSAVILNRQKHSFIDPEQQTETFGQQQRAASGLRSEISSQSSSLPDQS